MIIKRFLHSFLFLLVSITCKAQDTFSIVAIDSVTGEIGSAGASCIPVSLPAAPFGALLISDVLPGIGAIHTQAQWDQTNQTNAHAHMTAGDSAQQIIDWMQLHDAGGNSSIRQYGVVEYHGGHPQSAAFTGTNCSNYKNHITGPGYSIQGNILLGQQILDSMESGYLNATGTLADKLMSALQGANVVGADSRCAQFGLSSLSSFIRVALPTDSAGLFHLDLKMAYPNNAVYPVDPIDSLQSLYNSWKNSLSVQDNSPIDEHVRIYNDENEIIFDLSSLKLTPHMSIDLYDQEGKKAVTLAVDQKLIRVNKKENNLTRNIYMYRLHDENKYFASGKVLF